MRSLTRLLDFTVFSVRCLYFAVADSKADSGQNGNVRLWAINSEAVNQRFSTVALRPCQKKENVRAVPSERGSVLHPDDFRGARDTLITDTEGMRTLLVESISALGTRRAELNRQGCCLRCVASCFQSPTRKPARIISAQLRGDLSFSDRSQGS